MRDFATVRRADVRKCNGTSFWTHRIVRTPRHGAKAASIPQTSPKAKGGAVPAPNVFVLVRSYAMHRNTRTEAVRHYRNRCCTTRSQNVMAVATVLRLELEYSGSGLFFRFH